MGGFVLRLLPQVVVSRLAPTEARASSSSRTHSHTTHTPSITTDTKLMYRLNTHTHQKKGTQMTTETDDKTSTFESEILKERDGDEVIILFSFSN